MGPNFPVQPPKYGAMGNQKAMNESKPTLKVFSGQAIDFKYWAERFMDHMADVHIQWRHTLVWFSKTEEDVGFATLNQHLIGPFSEPAVELAQKLEATLIRYMPETLYHARDEMCGGEGEEHNGFKMWRRLFAENVGTSDIVTFAGIEAFREFPRCNKISEVVHHVDAWHSIFK